MHRTGHWLGLDVHDVGAYRLGEQPAPLESGMVLTVEPGLYVSDRLSVPEGQPEIEDRWKGIGIRIEDDVAVVETGHESLPPAPSRALPRWNAVDQIGDQLTTCRATQTTPTVSGIRPSSSLTRPLIGRTRTSVKTSRTDSSGSSQGSHRCP